MLWRFRFTLKRWWGGVSSPPKAENSKRAEAETSKALDFSFVTFLCIKTEKSKNKLPICSVFC